MKPGRSVFMIFLAYVEGVLSVNFYQWKMVRKVVLEEVGGRELGHELLKAEFPKTWHVSQVPDFGSLEQLFLASQEVLDKAGVDVSVRGEVVAPL